MVEIKTDFADRLRKERGLKPWQKERRMRLSKEDKKNLLVIGFSILLIAGCIFLGAYLMGVRAEAVNKFRRGEDLNALEAQLLFR